mmetsp:Transcript_9850/g.28315  ORF Transcript_9850/g.28315 Transcript_9850/m.28315 type:complete len:275 (+) Transcript_9850:1425-2249(+)
MLLDGHELDRVVAQASDAGEHPLAEEVVGVDVGLALRRHANVRLVDAKRLRGGRELVLELVLHGGVPEDAVVGGVGRGALGGLHRVAGPRRDARRLLAGRGGHGDLVARAVGDDGGAVGVVRNEKVPGSVLVPRVGVLSTVPVVEVAKQRHPLGIGSPLGGDDAGLLRVRAPAHAKLSVSTREVLERAFSVDDGTLESLVAAITVLQGALEALQRTVPAHHLAAVLLLPVIIRLLVPRHHLGRGELLGNPGRHLLSGGLGSIVSSSQDILGSGR